jgi:hypothetical protein
MYLQGSVDDLELAKDRRKYARFKVQCRARIRIGTRQYAGYIHNISQGGAKLRTISPIRKLGNVMLKLPDLPPLRCRLCWTDAYHAGVLFEIALSRSDLRRWAESRSEFQQLTEAPGAEIAELIELAD